MGSNCCKCESARKHPARSSASSSYRRRSRADAILDGRFTTSDDVDSVRLSIETASRADAGVYTLRASNAGGEGLTRVQLEVEDDGGATSADPPLVSGDDPPQFARRLTDLTVKVGIRTRFLVEIKSSTECRVTWHRNERRLLDAERVRLPRDGNFWCAELAAVSVDDAGRWTCTAENAGGRASCSAHLNVLIPKAYKRPEFVEELRALLTEQGTVSLECKVVGVPTPVLRWFKDSREIKAGDVFALTANAEDPTSLGTYTCEAVNCMGRAYSSSKVHVVGRSAGEGSTRPLDSLLSPESPPIFTKELEDQHLKISEMLTLSCHVVVPPWPKTVVWYNKEGRVESGDRYHIIEDGFGGYLLEASPAEWPDEGEWKCVATSNGGRVGITSCYVAMEVPKNYRKPRFMENLRAVLTEEGLVSFECKVVGFPTPVLSWFKDGQELKPGDVYQLTGTNSLGSYCCIAKNCMGQTSSSAELTIEDIQNQLNEEERLQLFSQSQAPKFIIGLKSLEAKIDDPFRFTVKVAIPPDPILYWYRDDQPVDASNRYQIGKEEKGTFYVDIRHLEFLDQAEWKCVAMNDFGHSVTSCFLKLIIPRHYKKPRFLENLQAILSDEGAVNLECKVIGVPSPVLKWYKDGEELKPGDIHKIISGQDGTCCLGTYTCEASNCMGIAASSASLLGFDDSLKSKISKKPESEQLIQRNLSLSTIHEERTSQMYDTPVGDITIDDKAEISFSFDGKEVSVSLYETPDLTEEEALQIVEMYAEQISENVSEHNLVELPPLRFVKETSTSGNLLMEAIIIDVSPDYFATTEEDLRTEADVEDMSIIDDTGPPQLSLDQDVGGDNYIEKTMAELTEEKSDVIKKFSRRKSDSLKSGDDYFSLSREQSILEEKKQEETQVFSDSELQTFASARSSSKHKPKTTQLESIGKSIESSEVTANIIAPKGYEILTKEDCVVPIKNKRERRESRSSRRSSSGSEKSLSRHSKESLHIEVTELSKENMLELNQEDIQEDLLVISDYLTKIHKNIQVSENDIITQSENMSSAATANRSLEMISNLINPIYEIQSIVDVYKETIQQNECIYSNINSIIKPLKKLQQTLAMIEKCVDPTSDNKTLVQRTCISFIEMNQEELQGFISHINGLIQKISSKLDQKTISEIVSITNDMNNVLNLSAEAIKVQNTIITSKEITYINEQNPARQHLKNTQKAIFELKIPVTSLLTIVNYADEIMRIVSSKSNQSYIICDEMTASIQDLQTALEHMEYLSVKENDESLPKYNTQIIENLVESVTSLRSSFEKLKIHSDTTTENDNVLCALSSVKIFLDEISLQIQEAESEIGPIDILQCENKMEVLQKMAQTLIALENNVERVETLSNVKITIESFHKALTKVLENVIQSNVSRKYFFLTEIGDAIKRINHSLKLIDTNPRQPLLSIAHTATLLRKKFKDNIFEEHLNSTIIEIIDELVTNIHLSLNKQKETSLHEESEKILEFVNIKLYTEKTIEVSTVMEKFLASITKIQSLESTDQLIYNLPTFVNLVPILEDLKVSIANFQSKIEEDCEISSQFIENTFQEILSNPIQVLNENIITMNQMAIDQTVSQSDSDLIMPDDTIAEPLIELHKALEVLQQDVLSQLGDDVSSNQIKINLASAIHNLYSCILAVQQNVGIELVDDMSTLEDVSGIKTHAEAFSADHLVLAENEQNIPVELEEQRQIQLPLIVTAKALRSLDEHIITLQQPIIIETFEILSHRQDYSPLKTVATTLKELHCAIEEIFHPVIIEDFNEMSLTLSDKLVAVAEPMFDLKQRFSVIDLQNIPNNEITRESNADGLYSIFETVTNFTRELENCINIISPALNSTQETVHISNTVSRLAELLIGVTDIISILKPNLHATELDNVEKFEVSVKNFQEVSDPSKHIHIDEIRIGVEELYKNVTLVQEDIMPYTSKPPDISTEMAIFTEVLDDLQNNIATLQRYDFVDLSSASEILPFESPQIASVIEIQQLNKIDCVIEAAEKVLQSCLPSEDIISMHYLQVEEFFKRCKEQFTVIKYRILKPLTHKRVIKLVEEFKSLKEFINTFTVCKSEFLLSETQNSMLATFLDTSNACMIDIQASLEEIVHGYSETLFKKPLLIINKVSNQIESQKVDESIYHCDIVRELQQHLNNLLRTTIPYVNELEALVIKELREIIETNEAVGDGDLLEIINKMKSFLSFASEKHTNCNIIEKELFEKLLRCFIKHDQYRLAVGTGKMLILLKCVSECANIFDTYLNASSDIIYLKMENEDFNENIKILVNDVLKPIQILETQLKIVREAIKGEEEESISVDMSSTGSFVQTIAEIDKSISSIENQIISKNSTLDNEDISLIMDVDKSINSIKASISAIEKHPESIDVASVIEPIGRLESSLQNILTLDNAVDNTIEILQTDTLEKEEIIINAAVYTEESNVPMETVDGTVEEKIAYEINITEEEINDVESSLAVTNLNVDPDEANVSADTTEIQEATTQSTAHIEDSDISIESVDETVTEKSYEELIIIKDKEVTSIQSAVDVVQADIITSTAQTHSDDICTLPKSALASELKNKSAAANVVSLSKSLPSLNENQAIGETQDTINQSSAHIEKLDAPIEPTTEKYDEGIIIKEEEVDVVQSELAGKTDCVESMANFGSYDTTETTEIQETNTQCSVNSKEYNLLNEYAVDTIIEQHDKEIIINEEEVAAQSSLDMVQMDAFESTAEIELDGLDKLNQCAEILTEPTMIAAKPKLSLSLEIPLLSAKPIPDTAKTHEAITQSTAYTEESNVVTESVVDNGIQESEERIIIKEEDEAFVHSALAVIPVEITADIESDNIGVLKQSAEILTQPNVNSVLRTISVSPSTLACLKEKQEITDILETLPTSSAERSKVSMKTTFDIAEEQLAKEIDITDEDVNINESTTVIRLDDTVNIKASVEIISEPSAESAMEKYSPFISVSSQEEQDSSEIQINIAESTISTEDTMIAIENVSYIADMESAEKKNYIEKEVTDVQEALAIVQMSVVEGTAKIGSGDSTNLKESADMLTQPKLEDTLAILSSFPPVITLSGEKLDDGDGDEWIDHIEQEELSSIIHLQNALNKIYDKIEQNFLSKNNRFDELEFIDSLDEVQIMIIMLKNKFDTIENSTLIESLEDLECNIRSAQLQICNTESQTDIMTDAFENLQHYITYFKENCERKTIKNCGITQNSLIKCHDLQNQTLQRLCENENIIDFSDVRKINLPEIEQSIISIQNNMKELKILFSSNFNIIIKRGIDIIQCLDDTEMTVLKLEQQCENIELIKPIVKDSMHSSVNVINESVKSMRNTLTNVQNLVLSNQYAVPFGMILDTIKNFTLLTKTDLDEILRKNIQDYCRCLRKTLKHFEDIKFYVNLDKAARYPNESKITKLVLRNLKSYTEVLRDEFLRYVVFQDIENVFNDVVIEIDKKLNILELSDYLGVDEKIPVFKDLAKSISYIGKSVQINEEKNDDANITTENEQNLLDLKKILNQYVNVMKLYNNNNKDIEFQNIPIAGPSLNTENTTTVLNEEKLPKDEKLEGKYECPLQEAVENLGIDRQATPIFVNNEIKIKETAAGINTQLIEKDTIIKERLEVQSLQEEVTTQTGQDETITKPNLKTTAEACESERIVKNKEDFEITLINDEVIIDQLHENQKEFREETTQNYENEYNVLKQEDSIDNLSDLETLQKLLNVDGKYKRLQESKETKTHPQDYDFSQKNKEDDVAHRGLQHELKDSIQTQNDTVSCSRELNSRKVERKQDHKLLQEDSNAEEKLEQEQIKEEEKVCVEDRPQKDIENLEQIRICIAESTSIPLNDEKLIMVKEDMKWRLGNWPSKNEFKIKDGNQKEGVNILEGKIQRAEHRQSTEQGEEDNTIDKLEEEQLQNNILNPEERQLQIVEGTTENSEYTNVHENIEKSCNIIIQKEKHTAITEVEIHLQNLAEEVNKIQIESAATNRYEQESKINKNDESVITQMKNDEETVMNRLEEVLSQTERETAKKIEKLESESSTSKQASVVDMIKENVQNNEYTNKLQKEKEGGSAMKSSHVDSLKIEKDKSYIKQIQKEDQLAKKRLEEENHHMEQEVVKIDKGEAAIKDLSDKVPNKEIEKSDQITIHKEEYTDAYPLDEEFIHKEREDEDIKLFQEKEVTDITHLEDDTLKKKDEPDKMRIQEEDFKRQEDHYLRNEEEILKQVKEKSDDRRLQDEEQTVKNRLDANTTQNENKYADKIRVQEEEEATTQGIKDDMLKNGRDELNKKLIKKEELKRHEVDILHMEEEILKEQKEKTNKRYFHDEEQYTTKGFDEDMTQNENEFTDASLNIQEDEVAISKRIEEDMLKKKKGELDKIPIQEEVLNTKNQHEEENHYRQNEILRKHKDESDKGQLREKARKCFNKELLLNDREYADKIQIQDEEKVTIKHIEEDILNVEKESDELQILPREEARIKDYEHSKLNKEIDKTQIQEQKLVANIELVEESFDIEEEIWRKGKDEYDKRPILLEEELAMNRLKEDMLKMEIDESSKIQMQHEETRFEDILTIKKQDLDKTQRKEEGMIAEKGIEESNLCRDVETLKNEKDESNQECLKEEEPDLKNKLKDRIMQTEREDADIIRLQKELKSAIKCHEQEMIKKEKEESDRRLMREQVELVARKRLQDDIFQNKMEEADNIQQEEKEALTHLDKEKRQIYIEDKVILKKEKEGTEPKEEVQRAMRIRCLEENNQQRPNEETCIRIIDENELSAEKLLKVEKLDKEIDESEQIRIQKQEESTVLRTKKQKLNKEYEKTDQLVLQVEEPNKISDKELILENLEYVQENVTDKQEVYNMLLEEEKRHQENKDESFQEKEAPIKRCEDQKMQDIKKQKIQIEIVDHTPLKEKEEDTKKNDKEENFEKVKEYSDIREIKKEEEVTIKHIDKLNLNNETQDAAKMRQQEDEKAKIKCIKDEREKSEQQLFQEEIAKITYITEEKRQNNEEKSRKIWLKDKKQETEKLVNVKIVSENMAIFKKDDTKNYHNEDKLDKDKKYVIRKRSNEEETIKSQIEKVIYESVDTKKYESKKLSIDAYSEAPRTGEKEKINIASKDFDIERKSHEVKPKISFEEDTHFTYKDLSQGRTIRNYKYHSEVRESTNEIYCKPIPKKATRDILELSEDSIQYIEHRQTLGERGSKGRLSVEKRGTRIRDSKRKPVFSTHLTDRTAVEGSRVKLTCSVLTSSDPTVIWYRNGLVLDNRLKYRKNISDGLITLEVLNAEPSDSAKYSCKVSNANGEVSESANLRVYPSFEASPIPPTFTRSIRDMYHLAEDELVLECRIRGQPLPVITWMKNGNIVETTDRYHSCYLADGVCRLTISHPSAEDSGKYTCKAENSIWTDQITHVVDFKGYVSPRSSGLNTVEKSRYQRQTMEFRRPHFSNILTDHTVPSGGTIGLQVEIRGSPSEVEWLREGRRVTELFSNARTFKEQELYTLALPDVTEKASGLYTCRAWNTYGKVDMTAAVKVLQPNDMKEGKPAIIIGRPEKDILISVGEDINISFRVQGDPKPKVSWLKGSRDITNSYRSCKMTSDDYVMFTLKRSGVSDAGTYCILTKNIYGADRAFVTVVVRQRASSENFISDWTYPDDGNFSYSGSSHLRNVPTAAGEPVVTDGGNNWVSLTWDKPACRSAAPVLAYKIECWLIGAAGGARWTELGITPINSYDAFNLKQGEEYHFRVTPRNRHGWGESVQTSNPICVGMGGYLPEFVEILPGQLKALKGDRATLRCCIRGKPAPQVVWLKNGQELEEIDSRVLTTFNGYECCLVINEVRMEDDARYSCEAVNAIGRVSTYARLSVITDRKIWEADIKLNREMSEESSKSSETFPPQFTMRPRDRRVQMTYPVRLTCQVTGNPAPSVTWYKDGELLLSDDRRIFSQDEHFHTLEIGQATLADGGVYEVTAHNMHGTVSCKCNLVVDKGIRAYISPEFCCGLEPLYIVPECGELRISAAVEAYPSVGVAWHRDGIRLRPSRRTIMTLDRDGSVELAIANITTRDAGVYTCTATNEVGTSTTSCKVEVLDEGGGIPVRDVPTLFSPETPYSKEPMFVKKPRSSEAYEGDTVIIHCEVVGDPKPDVVWLRDFLKPDYYRDASHFRRVDDGPVYRFEIPHAKLDFTGAYSVIAKNCHGEAKAVISLQIYAKGPDSTDSHDITHGNVDVLPSIKRPLNDLRCCDGDSITFKCLITGKPRPSVRWKKDDRRLETGGDFISTYEGEEACLTLRTVFPEDQGQYSCVAYNDLGNVVTSACLIVDVPEERSNLLSQQLSRPPDLLSAASTPRSTPRATPSRSRATTPNMAEYLHDVKKKQLATSSVSSCLKKKAPKFYAYPHNRVVEEGGTARFQCAVAGHPAPWASWDKDGAPLTATARLTISEKDDVRIVEIEHVTLEDAGLYRIVLENDVGRAEATARLDVITLHSGARGGVRTYNSPRRSPAVYRHLVGSAIRAGERLKLQAEIHSSTQTKYNWYRNAIQVPDSSKIFKTVDGGVVTLQIDNITKDFTGEYMVTAENHYGISSSFADVAVVKSTEIPELGPPIFSAALPAIHTIIEGEKLKLMCQVNSPIKFIISWYANNVKLSPSHYFEHISCDDHWYALCVNDTYIEDGGIYRCHAESENGVCETFCNVIVKEYFKLSANLIEDELRCRFSRVPISVATYVGSSAIFSCQIYNPKVNDIQVVWYIAGMEVKKDDLMFHLDRNGQNYDLYILRVSRTMVGEVRCVMRRNDCSSTPLYECSATLNIIPNTIAFDTPRAGSATIPASLRHLTRDITVSRGETIKIRAVVGGKPKPKITWRKSGCTIRPDFNNKFPKLCEVPHHNGIEFLVMRASDEDAGIYNIRVENEECTVSSIVSVRVIGVPDAPKGKPVVSEANREVSIVWSPPPYDGSRMVTEYHVEMASVSMMKDHEDYMDLEWKEVAIVKTLTVNIGGLECDEVYYFRVKAINAQGAGPPSEVSDPISLDDEEDKCDEQSIVDVRIQSIEIYEKDYEVMKTLGHGNYGVVKLIKYIASGKKLAAKVIDAHNTCKRENAINEVNILNKLSHNKLLHLMAAFESPSKIIMVTEFLSGGELFERVSADDFNLTEEDCILFIKQICEGVAFMHRNSVVHLDLKPENIMCKTRASKLIKIIDFGLARVLNPSEPLNVAYGTRDFISPEVVNYEPVCFETDMWSIGVISYVLLSGLVPFKGDTWCETLVSISNVEYDFQDEAFELVSEDAKDFIQKLLMKEPKKRLTSLQSLAHSWIARQGEVERKAKINKDKLRKFTIRRKWQHFKIKRRTG